MLHQIAIGLAAIAATLLLPHVRADPDEMIVLANCVNSNNGNDQSSQIAYFSHNTDPSPASVARVQTEAGRTAFWEGGSPVSATFGDGNIFSASIPNQVTQQDAFVGTGKNNAGTFSCWTKWQPNKYSADGASCSGVYICDHRPQPGNTIEVHVDVGPDSVSFRDVDVSGMFWSIWTRRNRNDCKRDPAPIDGTKCTISYDCFGTTDWTITNGMGNTLAGPLGKAVLEVKNFEARECDEALDFPPHKCISYIDVKHSTTKVISHGRLDVSNISPTGSNIPNSLAGWLTWDITCPSPPGADCSLCKVAQGVLMTGAAAGTATTNPLVAAAFGLANVLTSALCAADKC